jgi:hypothetical protein
MRIAPCYDTRHSLVGNSALRNLPRFLVEDSKDVSPVNKITRENDQKTQPCCIKCRKLGVRPNLKIINGETQRTQKRNAKTAEILALFADFSPPACPPCSSGGIAIGLDPTTYLQIGDLPLANKQVVG